MPLTIRPETPTDQTGIYHLNALAFGQDGESQLVDLLRDSNAFVPELSLVAVLDGRIVGHILFSKIKIVTADNTGVESLALAPMAVHPEFQKKGIGGQLIRRGLEVAESLGFKSVIVLGHEHYYPKFGFVPAARWNIKAPFEVPDNVFMALELVDGALDNAAGTVRYPEAFEIV